MSFQSTLENLRAKPEHVRSHIAFWSSFGITAIIFAFWLGSFNTVNVLSGSDSLAAKVDKAGTPADSLVAGVGGLFDSLKERIFGPRTIKYAEVEVRAGDK